MEKKPIYNRNNPRPVVKALESHPSTVVPTTVMSIRTLMERYARGLPLTQNVKQPLYHNGEFPDISGLDLSEVQELKRQAAQQVQELQQKLKNQEEYKQFQKEKEIKEKIKDLETQLAVKEKQPVL